MNTWQQSSTIWRQEQIANTPWLLDGGVRRVEGFNIQSSLKSCELVDSKLWRHHLYVVI